MLAERGTGGDTSGEVEERRLSGRRAAFWVGEALEAVHVQSADRATDGDDVSRRRGATGTSELLAVVCWAPMPVHGSRV